jgi:hypothetical protein
MSTFKTANGIKFTVDLKTKDVKAVKELVKYPDGRAIDIFEAAETGMLHGIYGNIETLWDVMFVICLDQIKEHFDLQKFDEANRKTYELFPEQATEPPLTKASRWFGSIIDGNTLDEMVKAFNEAVVNFIPNENRRTALRTIFEKEQETERLESEYRIQTVNMMYEQTKATLSEQWDKIGKQEVQKLVSQLVGPFDSSGSMPESAESIPPSSPSGN